jgi:hypothetical protein
MHPEMLLLGMALLLYGGMVTFYSPAAAYINKISLDRKWLPPHLAKYSIRFIDGACTLGLGAALIFLSFFA